MPRAHRYEMLPHIHALLALVEQADAPELLFREIVALLVHEAPIIVEAHVIRSADHVEGVNRLAAALMGHVQAGRASRVAGMRRVVLEAADFDDLTRFVHHGDLPLDNNEAEREFQRHAKLRFASLFAGSPEGGHRWATLLGVVRTAQKCEVDVFAYLTWLFERRGSHRNRFDMKAADLTPMAYTVAGMPGAVRRAA